MAKYIETHHHGSKQIDLSHLPFPMELRPTEMHMNNTGSKTDKPTIAMVFTTIGITYYAQMSLQTLTDCLNELGYEVTKK